MNKYSDSELIQSFFEAWNDGNADDIKSSLLYVVYCERQKTWFVPKRTLEQRAPFFQIHFCFLYSG